MLIVRPFSGGITCWTDTYRVMPGTGYHSEAAILSLFGDRVSVRAIWAKVHDRNRKHDAVLEVGDRSIAVEQGMVMTSTMLGADVLHLMMIHPAMTHQWSPFATWFMVAGAEDEARALFFNRLNRTCPVPFRPRWCEDLWRLGRAARVIAELDGYGLPAYRVDSSVEVWGQIVKKAIQDGSLS